jgi:diamine N-acetyltransferase
LGKSGLSVERLPAAFFLLLHHSSFLLLTYSRAVSHHPAMPDGVSIRAAHVADAASLADFARRTYSEAFGHSFQPADLAAHLKRSLSAREVARFIAEDDVLLAAAEARIVGYAQFGAARPAAGVDTAHAQELRRLYVDPAFQNHGIGASLMNAALAHPRMKSAVRIFVEVWEHNQGAQRFYARYGFRVVGVRGFTVVSGADTSHELLMAREQ